MAHMCVLFLVLTQHFRKKNHCISWCSVINMQFRVFDFLLRNEKVVLFAISSAYKKGLCNAFFFLLGICNLCHPSIFLSISIRYCGSVIMLECPAWL